MDKNYHFIRGKRIVDQWDDIELFEKSSYVDLERNVLNFVPVSTKRQNAVDPVRITQLETLPAIGMKTLRAWATANSTESKSGSGTIYQPAIIFTGVEFEDEDTQNNITAKARDGNDYHMQPIDLAQTNVKVTCQCMDFYWRFRDQNAADQSGIAGKKPPYKPVSNRGPVNPQNVPGLCKHLLATFRALKHSGMVR